MSAKDEVEYCGRCDRQQSAGADKCKVCGRPTVTWDTSRESATDIRRKWKTLYG